MSFVVGFRPYIYWLWDLDLIFSDLLNPFWHFLFHFNDLSICSVHSLFLLCLLSASCLGWATEGMENRGTSSLFLWLDAFIDSASAASILTQQLLNHAHSMLHPCRTLCVAVIDLYFLWLLSTSVFLCCDVQIAIRQGVWNEELWCKMWCISFWIEKKCVIFMKTMETENQKHY